MNVFVELHALRSFPPSNLNRDDLGSPKTAVFGGTRRLRISSQCLKRTWRTSEHFKGAFADENLGIRTARLPDQVIASAGEDLDDVARAGLIALLASIGRKDKKGSAADEDEEAAREGEKAGNEAAEAEGGRTAHLLYLSRQEIDAVSSFARENTKALQKIKTARKVDNKALKSLRDALKAYLLEKAGRNAVDVALFGRFVTSDEIDTIPGALQVAHGLGTQKLEVEYDYFTAVDDLGDTTGAGHLGESEFASSVLYLYACCDLGQLERNLGVRTADGRVADAEATQLARRSLPALVRAMAEATPKGKKTGTAPYTPAEYVEVVVRRGAPLSYANAFLKPVSAREADGDVMAASIERLIKHRGSIEGAYGRDEDAAARRVLSLRDSDTGGTRVQGIKELTTRLAQSLESIGTP